MRGMMRRTIVPVMVGLACAAWASTARTQTPAQAPLPPQSRVTVTAGFDNGAEVHIDNIVMRVTAVRQSIVRVRIGRDGKLPEDASWAVPSQVRSTGVRVHPASDAQSIGFSTDALDVRIDRATLRLVVRDKVGRVVSADAPGEALQLNSTGFSLRKVMGEHERFFGLGDKTGGLDRRDHAFTLWNTDAYAFGDGSDPLYKSIPFFLAGGDAQSSYGLLLDNSFRSSFDFGKSERDVLRFGAESGPIDYYIIYGPHPKQVLEGYALLTGTQPLPPRWALGFQQSRYSYMTAARVREIATNFRRRKIPADVIYMDIDYQDRNRPFTTNPKTFPNIKSLMGEMKAQGFHIVTIVDLHVAAAPGQNYLPYDSGRAGDHFVHNPDGSVYVGKVWPGDSVFPDFTRAATRAWYGALYTDFAKAGVSGIWNDMNEPAIFERLDKTMPLDVVSRIDEPGFVKRTATQAEIHNIFGMQNTRATYDGLRTLNPDERAFVLTRASFAGGQRYAYTWTGDNSATWDHLRLATPQLLNLGMSGFVFSGVDVGGYAGMPSPELMSRWIAIHAFMPLFRAHSESGMPDKEPWAQGPIHEAIRKHFIEERYRLMPYIYTLAEEASRTGIPLARPVFLEFPERMGRSFGKPSDDASSFMLGSALLIATPQFGGSANEYRYGFNLPAGEWYDYWTGRAVKTHEIKLAPRIDQLPVFVRAGSIIPRQALIQHDGETPKGPLELHIYPGPDCQGTLYTDDGHSMAYQKGVYLRQQFRCTTDGDRLTVHFDQREGSFPAFWSTVALYVHGGRGKAAPRIIADHPQMGDVMVSIN